MGWWLFFAVFLFLISAVLILAEVFVPSGGLLSILAAACLIGGIIIFFNYSVIAGLVGIIVALILIPTVLVFAYKLFPFTKFGKSVTLNPPEREAGDAIPDTNNLKKLLGQTGNVIADLRPVGICDFAGQRVECVAETGYIDEGKKVTVIKVEGTQLTVRENKE